MAYGRQNHNRRIAITGTYSTGKTTTSGMISDATGISHTGARTLRQILPDVFPGKRLSECTPGELCQLGMERLHERIINEHGLKNGFVSDGSAINEWAYGKARMTHGANGPGTEITDPGYAFSIDNLGGIAKRYSKGTYTDIVHLPIEFPMVNDGHRPVSEDFRKKAEDIQLEALEEIGMKYTTVTGTPQERIRKIVEELGLEVSSTLYGPVKLDGGKIWYEKAEDALGPKKGRFFSHGFKKANHDIYDIEVDPGTGIIRARVTIGYDGDWSQKNGQAMKMHLTSNDPIAIVGQLGQILMYTQDGITREQSNNLWLRDLRLIPGNTPVEDLDGLSVEIKQTASCRPKLCGRYWHTSTFEVDIGNGAYKAVGKVGYMLPESYGL